MLSVAQHELKNVLKILIQRKEKKKIRSNYSLVWKLLHGILFDPETRTARSKACGLHHCEALFIRAFESSLDFLILRGKV